MWAAVARSWPASAASISPSPDRVMRSLLLTAVFVATDVAVPLVRALPPQASGGNAPMVSDVKVLRFGKLWDGSKVITAAVVVVEGERVKSVGVNSAVPPNSQVIDLSKFYGIPGLIDTHT